MIGFEKKEWFVNSSHEPDILEKSKKIFNTFMEDGSSNRDSKNSDTCKYFPTICKRDSFEDFLL